MKNEIPQAAVLLVSAVPFQSWMGRQFAKLRVETATKTDKRIRLMNEIINGMKVIKMYTWEKPFARLVHEARKEEIRVIRKTAFFRFGFRIWIFCWKTGFLQGGKSHILVHSFSLHLILYLSCVQLHGGGKDYYAPS